MGDVRERDGVHEEHVANRRRDVDKDGRREIIHRRGTGYDGSGGDGDPEQAKEGQDAKRRDRGRGAASGEDAPRVPL